jgi:Tol biopolymer transport system component/tRNA A-37 threonylcarbamoyl transferase component Bud32
VERELGQGGMATVFLAEDLKHGRHVAIKLLHPELSAILGGERFLAEIKVTAKLQHPHILGLIDSGEADGLLYYVMPYVAGESLRARLLRERQLPVDDAIRLAREVAAALDYAHRQGVVHRDIKPENILLLDGAALVADFGIALAVQQAGGHRMTQTGISLGTPAYMSPEQAMGEREIGPRSDVYALGAMSYEMLAGEPPFTGPSSQAIVAKVLTEQPPSLRHKRPLVPPAAEAAILRALQKLPADRWGSAREFAEALAGSGPQPAAGVATVPIGAVAAGTRSLRSATFWLAWIVAGVATAVAAWALLRPSPAAPPLRLAIVTPGLGGSGGGNSLQRHLAFLPGGDGLVYSVQEPNGQLHLARHPLDAEGPTPIEGTAGLSSPMVSPDGRWLVATSGSRGQAFRVSIEGGTRELVAQRLLDSDLGSWASDGTLWFTSDGRLGRIVGDSLAIRTRQGTYELQQVLPDNRTAVVVRTVAGSAGPVLLVDLESGEEQPLLGTSVIEARVTHGFLVVVVPGGNLQAIPLTDDGRGVTGTPFTVAANVATTGTGVAQIAVAPNGNVAYIPEEPFSLVLVDRTGASRAVMAERHNFHHPMFSPDGRRLSLDFNSAEGRNVWVLALKEGGLSRATFSRDGHDATWTPDGRFLTYTAPVPGREGLTLALLRKPPGSAQTPETLLVSHSLAYTGLWLPDESGLLTVALNLRREPGRPDSGAADTRADIAIVRNRGKGPLDPVLVSPFAEHYIGLSPDGRYMCFVSEQSGRAEVYLRALAGEQDQVLVSLEGGTEPVWSRDGREVFHRETRAENPHLIAAAVSTGPAITVTRRTPLFPVGDIVGGSPHANYDVSPDGKSFVMVRRSPAARIIVIQNLPGLVRRLRGDRGRG